MNKKNIADPCFLLLTFHSIFGYERKEKKIDPKNANESDEEAVTRPLVGIMLAAR